MLGTSIELHRFYYTWGEKITRKLISLILQEMSLYSWNGVCHHSLDALALIPFIGKLHQ